MMKYSNFEVESFRRNLPKKLQIIYMKTLHISLKKNLRNFAKNCLKCIFLFFDSSMIKKQQFYFSKFILNCHGNVSITRRANSGVKMCHLILSEIRPVAYLQAISLWNKI